MRRTSFALLAAVIAASLSTGCGYLHRSTERKNTAYMKSVEERPLEVPPDLDHPNSSGALVIPSVSATGTASAAATPPSAAPTTTLPAASGVSLGGEGLHVADTVDSTWSRVGLALERSGAATILARDEAGHAYTVETTGQTTSEAGWLKRAVTLGRAGGKTTAKVQLTVRVNADGADKSTISIEGGTDAASQDAARALLATLRQRLS